MTVKCCEIVCGRLFRLVTSLTGLPKLSSRRRTQPWFSLVFGGQKATQTLHGRDRVDSPRDDPACPRSLGLVGQPAFQQLSVGENDAADCSVDGTAAEIRVSPDSRPRRSRRRRRLCAAAKPMIPLDAGCRLLCSGLAPERRQKCDRSAGRSHVFDFPARQPVIDGPATHPDELACSRNRHGLSFRHHRFRLSELAEKTVRRMVGAREKTSRADDFPPVS